MNRILRNKTQRGFTLIELMVVVAMIGVLSALAIAGYRKYSASAGTSRSVTQKRQVLLPACLLPPESLGATSTRRSKTK